jgi:hypothetical protein
LRRHAKAGKNKRYWHTTKIKPIRGKYTITHFGAADEDPEIMIDETNASWAHLEVLHDDLMPEHSAIPLPAPEPEPITTMEP